jgi:hypothetical protein
VHLLSLCCYGEKAGAQIAENRSELTRKDLDLFFVIIVFMFACDDEP